MFLLSKLVWIAIQPLSLSFFLILASLAFGAIGFGRLRTASAALSAVLLFVTLYTSTGAVLLQALENRFPRPAALPEDLACIVVLGGGFENEVTSARGGFEMNQSGDRFVETLRLARDHPQARILISGGDGSFSGDYEGDAIVAARFFPAFGVGADRLIQEKTSRTTFENVRNLKAFLEENRLENCALVTSAFHMPRSVGLMRQAGLVMTPWPADYRTRGDHKLALDFSQPSTNTALMTTAVREWTGLFAYYMTGRIGTPFPQ